MQKQSLNYIEFSSDDEHRLLINKKAMRIFKKYEQKKGRPEAGGILLGYLYSDYDEIVKVTTPNQFDVRDIFFFNRSKIPAQLKINKSWKKSKGTLIYLGEWHTHCEVDPSPSIRDKAMIEKVFKETEMKIDFLYLVIVGLNDTYWVGKQTDKGLKRLK